MAKYRVARQAQIDLQEIWDYIAADNHTAADRWIEHLASRFMMLAEQPGLGPRRPEFRPDLRSLPIGNYIILYRSTQNGVEIVRVVHGARDIKILFRPDDSAAGENHLE